eukprot:747939-Hanusia_phi.AAC.6
MCLVRRQAVIAILHLRNLPRCKRSRLRTRSEGFRWTLLTSSRRRSAGSRMFGEADSPEILVTYEQEAGARSDGKVCSTSNCLFLTTSHRFIAARSPSSLDCLLHFFVDVMKYEQATATSAPPVSPLTPRSAVYDPL